jgi:hypothetical protein
MNKKTFKTFECSEILRDVEEKESTKRRKFEKKEP